MIKPETCVCDLSAKAESLVSKQEVSNEVSNETAVSERQTIELNAQMLADIVPANELM